MFIVKAGHIHHGQNRGHQHGDQAEQNPHRCFRFGKEQRNQAGKRDAVKDQQDPLPVKGAAFIRQAAKERLEHRRSKGKEGSDQTADLCGIAVFIQIRNKVSPGNAS